MKLSSILGSVSLAASVAHAAPAAVSARADDPVNTTRNDLTDGEAGACPGVILIFARGSNEPGNLGDSSGLVLATTLEAEYDGIWIQGVGPEYDAGLPANLLPKGTTQKAIDEAKALFTLANTKCPDAKVVTGGYSQGTCVVGYALAELTGTPIQEQVVGAVLFGYTKNEQNGERIPKYPTERTAIYCEEGDAVCNGSLVVLPDHFLYDDDAANEAPAFLRGVIG